MKMLGVIKKNDPQNAPLYRRKICAEGSGVSTQQVDTDTRGDTWLYSDGGYGATNDVIHGWILNCISLWFVLE